MSIISKVGPRVDVARLKAKAIAGAFIVTIAGIAAAATLAGASAAPVSTPDCDNNAVVYCGASSVSTLQKKYKSGDGHNSAASIHNIYDYSKFAISSSDISSMSSQAVSGYVTKTGDVYAGGKLVATNALTAGRQNISGSTKVNNGGTTFYARKPSVSFQNSELSAMVDMKSGVFQFAILTSCGNPVAATPKKPSTPPPAKKPNYTIVKQVRAGTSGNFASDISVKSGSQVEYQIIVSSTGQAPADNVVVHDTLPTGIKFTAGTLQENGSVVSAADAGKFFGSGLNVGSVKNGSKDVFTFDATAGAMSADDSSCQEDTLTNTGFVSATGLTGRQSSATVKTICTPPKQPQFTYVCDNFTVGVDNITRKVTVTAFKASTNNPDATLSNVVIDWGDGSTNTVAADQATSQAHIFTADSSTITATGQFTISGETAPVNGTSCTQQVSFTRPGTPPTTPTPPQLPNTGAGDTIGLFLGTVVAGTVGFRVFVARKLARR